MLYGNAMRLEHLGNEGTGFRSHRQWPLALLVQQLSKGQESGNGPRQNAEQNCSADLPSQTIHQGKNSISSASDLLHILKDSVDGYCTKEEEKGKEELPPPSSSRVFDKDFPDKTGHALLFAAERLAQQLGPLVRR